MEMMDNLSIQAVEAAVHAGYPRDAAAVLLIEVDGVAEAMDGLVEGRASARSVESAGPVRSGSLRRRRERNLLWAGRKHASGPTGGSPPRTW